MNWNNCELRLLVKGRPVTEYAHMGNVFIEGREGSEFEIEFTNRNPFRVEAVISVDGLSVLDGKAAGVQSSGYLVEAHSTTRIPGWKLDASKVAKFFFAGKGESYATGATGSSQNNGVIGAMVFKERPVVPKTYTTGNINMLGLGQPYNLGDAGGWVGGYVHSNLASGVPFQGNMTITGSSADSVSYTSDSIIGASLSASGGQASNSAFRDKARSLKRGTETKMKGLTSRAQPEPTQNLGTGFGAAQEFTTTEVEFNRGDLLGMMVVYYDNLRGLRARGVPVPRKAYRAVNTPQAFPASTGCAPPPGWKG